MDMNTRLQPGKVYSYTIVIGTARAVQEQFGEWQVQPGDTVQSVLDAVRRFYADRMGLYVSQTRTTSFNLRQK